MLNHNYIGTEHILLGLIREGEGVGAKALVALGISLSDVRRDVKEIIGQGEEAPSGHIPFTPRAKKVLELSLREALALGHNYIGTEHILLGLVGEGEGVGAQVLQKQGATLNRVRQEVISLLSGSTAAGIPVGFTREEPVEPEGGPTTPVCPRCRADLADALTTTVIALASDQRHGPGEVVVTYCSRCGTALGAWPYPGPEADEPGAEGFVPR